WPRTPDFQSGNTGSNPVGDTTVVGNAPTRQQGRVVAGRVEVVPPRPVGLLVGLALDPRPGEELPEHLPGPPGGPGQEIPNIGPEAGELPAAPRRVERGHALQVGQPGQLSGDRALPALLRVQLPEEGIGGETPLDRLQQMPSPRLHERPLPLQEGPTIQP